MKRKIRTMNDNYNDYYGNNMAYDSYGTYPGQNDGEYMNMENYLVENNKQAVDFRGYMATVAVLAVLSFPVMLCLIVTQIEYEVIIMGFLMALMGILSLTHRRHNIFSMAYMLIMTIVGMGGIITAIIDMIVSKQEILTNMMGGNVGTRIMGLMIVGYTFIAFAVLYDYNARIKEECTVLVNAKVVDIEQHIHSNGPAYCPVSEYVYGNKIHRYQTNRAYSRRHRNMLPEIGSMFQLYVNPFNYNEAYFVLEGSKKRAARRGKYIRIYLFVMAMIVAYALFKIPLEG